jgi:hypothetical protein
MELKELTKMAQGSLAKYFQLKRAICKPSALF